MRRSFVMAAFAATVLGALTSAEAQAPGFDTQHAVLACYSGAGFDRELQASQRPDIRLVDLGQLYAY